MGKKRKSEWKYEWPKISVDCPEEVFVQWLRYWEETFTRRPKKGEWKHPDDVQAEKERLAAIRVLLKFVTK